MSKDESDSYSLEACLAEFSALRAELLQRIANNWNIFALQLTAAGVIFSFALSSSGRTGFLLILPLTTYALAGRYKANLFAINSIGTYIREILGPRTQGALYWGDWLRKHPQVHTLVLLNPLFLAFPGVSVIALVWVAPYVWVQNYGSNARQPLLIAVWFLAVILTGISFHTIGRGSQYWSRLPLVRRSGLKKSRENAKATPSAGAD